MPSSDASLWRDEGSNFSFTGDDINALVGDRAMSSTPTFTGDFTFEAIYKTNSSDHISMGFYAVNEDGAFNTGAAFGATHGMTNAGSLNANGIAWYSGTSQGTVVTMDTTSIIKFERVGSTFKIYQGGVLQFTFTDTYSGEVRMYVASGFTNSPALADYNYTDNVVTFTPHGIWI